MRTMHWVVFGAAWSAACLSGCGGGGDAAAPPLDVAATTPTGRALPPTPAGPSTSKAAGQGPATAVPTSNAPVNAAAAPATGDPGLLLLLLPDGQDMGDPRIAAWLDAASEVGVRLLPVTDTQFAELGTRARAFAGLVLPDSLHTRASDSLIEAITRYTAAGGHTMLTFDFGALLPSGFFPVTGGSRLSGLAGVQYVLYDTLLDQTTGFGPIQGLRSSLRQLQVPPGKSLPTAVASTSPTGTLSTGTTALKAAEPPVASALYLPVSPNDPGGAHGFDPQQYLELRYAASRHAEPVAAPPRQVLVDQGRAFSSTLVRDVTPLALSRALVQRDNHTDPSESYSGYLVGPLKYPSYVTQGTFGGSANPGQTQLVASAQFGLVAGINPVGAGQVLFVNLPLTYLKGRTDALPMHGFLHYFSHQMMQMAHLSTMPNGVAGLTLDWHLDAKEAQAPTRRLVQKNVFNDPGALFSIEMTAGPDLLHPGDGLGWNLPSNQVAKGFLRDFNRWGHAVGSHGGWIHNHYGSLASDTNQFTFTGGACDNRPQGIDNYEQCLTLNRTAVDRTLGIATRSYSAPEGNNPLWAMRWLEQRGVVVAYFGGHTGLGVTRQYRDGRLLNPGVWVSPVTPQGLYATFEEFQDHQVPKAEVSQWYRDLMDFNVAQNTSRMVYAHPTGADAWFDVLSGMLSYAKSRRDAGQLAWYTMPRLADFMSARAQVTWSEQTDATNGATRFNAAHPLSLNEFTWRLPRSRYPQPPVVVSGNAAVDASQASHWLLRAGPGTQLSFVVQP